jgi:hypothetical protein
MIPEEIDAERLKLEYRLAQLGAQDKAKSSFIDFARYVWPSAIIGEHHAIMAKALTALPMARLNA